MKSPPPLGPPEPRLLPPLLLPPEIEPEVEPRPSEPRVAELDGPLERVDLAGELTRALAPPEAERADLSEPPPALPAEDAKDSPPPEKPELLEPPPEAAPEVLASDVPPEATELGVARDDEPRSPPLPPETVTVTVPPPRPPLDIATDVIPPLEDPPRPPRRDGAIREIYFSAAVTPVRRSVFSMAADSAGAVRTATTFVCWAVSWRCRQVQ